MKSFLYLISILQNVSQQMELAFTNDFDFYFFKNVSKSFY